MTFYTCNTLALSLGVTRSTVFRWFQRGYIKPDHYATPSNYDQKVPMFSQTVRDDAAKRLSNGVGFRDLPIEPPEGYSPRAKYTPKRAAFLRGLKEELANLTPREQEHMTKLRDLFYQNRGVSWLFFTLLNLSEEDLGEIGVLLVEKGEK